MDAGTRRGTRRGTRHGARLGTRPGRASGCASGRATYRQTVKGTTAEVFVARSAVQSTCMQCAHGSWLQRCSCALSGRAMGCGHWVI
eukprot:gene11450-biopygen6367